MARILSGREQVGRMAGGVEDDAEHVLGRAREWREQRVGFLGREPPGEWQSTLP